MTRLAQAGLGEWGKNLVRNFDELAEIVWLCDVDAHKRDVFEQRYPTARVTDNFDDILAGKGMRSFEEGDQRLIKGLARKRIDQIPQGKQIGLRIE